MLLFYSLEMLNLEGEKTPNELAVFFEVLKGGGGSYPPCALSIERRNLPRSFPNVLHSYEPSVVEGGALFESKGGEVRLARHTRRSRLFWCELDESDHAPTVWWM
eukprot:gb/GECG01000022.1/.p1 GENE.gb/GECG01000022.1/~~gb/GECG01000022.1/.p1  ORF type:complete len:105 (+),score=4.64 gb/GECG01000022.1/:1-315(+)